MQYATHPIKIEWKKVTDVWTVEMNAMIRLCEVIQPLFNKHKQNS